MVDIETQLREAARKSGMSMKRISEESGIPYAAVHGFVARDRSLLLSTASKLATLLELELRPIARKRKAGRR
jgi:hypothetical protein